MVLKTLTAETIMKFYTFRQNNSGGSFYGPHYVIIEAESPEAANLIAENTDEVNIYFDGCALGIDCNCCGDRWSRVYESDANDKLMIYNQEIDPKNPVYKDGYDGPEGVVVIRNASSAGLSSKQEERMVAADLLSDHGFQDIADFLRGI